MCDERLARVFRAQPVRVPYIVISAIVTNPTDRDIRVLAKNNVLDTSTTNSFSVSKDGKDVLFTGIRVSIPPFCLYSG